MKKKAKFPKLRNAIRKWLGINSISMELHEVRDIVFKINKEKRKP